ncbi:hypothetical protein ZIOFF_029143 [Zingiber officinale]|uniref:Uncharacterized protein n=1 Tax=Zingiber officinale TaxID=94328 RepID=A0A8J5L3Z9_ZINOF|nr:hypothetical protein ZIOFF_029143 [Zingiber officinale]
MLSICKKNGLILSPTKMKIDSSTIEFLGAVIGPSTIKLQAHIISKIANFKDQELTTAKGLRSWLGLLNYCRSYIPNLGRLLSPLYSKTSPNGERKMNSHDWALIHKIKKMITDLPDLAIPPEKCYIILETDGCMEGWGGVCKWKFQKYDPKTMDFDGEGSSSTNPNRRSIITNPDKAQYQGIPSPSGPHHLLEQYAELAYSGRTSILHPEEHDKRSHMADIEWTVARNVINNLRELELICQVMGNNFRRRSHHEGQSTY